jgi:hypothetical protein
MKRTSIFIFITFIFYSCSSVKYLTIYNSAQDPTYDLCNKKTVAFYPKYWTSVGKKQGFDQLLEKQIFFHCKKELEKRGFQMTYIEPVFLEETSENLIKAKKEMGAYDLTMVVEYYQKQTYVEIPGKSQGNIFWGNTGGWGAYGTTSSYTVWGWDLIINCSLWNGNAKKVWFGQIIQGSPSANIGDRTEKMVNNLFSNKFPRCS